MQYTWASRKEGAQVRPYGSAKSLEARRRRAAEFLKSGLSFHETARRIGCHPSSVLRWSRALKRGGPDGLKPRPVPGRPAKLTPRQRRRLVGRLILGAAAAGYRTNLWTTQRIAELIERRFHVKYHRDHVGRLLHQLGWSHQKPERRAVERDEAAIERWKRTDWPRVKKTPHGWAPICFSSTNRASC
jgi:transposase